MPPNVPDKKPVDRQEWNPRAALAFVDNLNKAVREEHEQDMAKLPPHVRAQKTEAEWLETPPLEIMQLAKTADPQSDR